MVLRLTSEYNLILGVKSAVRSQIFPEAPKPEFIGVNGAGGFVFEKDIPPNFPEHLKDSMNFIFGKNAFFGIGPASDGVQMAFVEHPNMPRE